MQQQTQNETFKQQIKLPSFKGRKTGKKYCTKTEFFFLLETLQRKRGSDLIRRASRSSLKIS